MSWQVFLAETLFLPQDILHSITFASQAFQIPILLFQTPKYFHTADTLTLSGGSLRSSVHIHLLFFLFFFSVKCILSKNIDCTVVKHLLQNLDVAYLLFLHNLLLRP